MVAGANSGIGEAIIRAFAGEGATVVVNYVSKGEKRSRFLLRLKHSRGDNCCNGRYQQGKGIRKESKKSTI